MLCVLCAVCLHCSARALLPKRRAHSRTPPPFQSLFIATSRELKRLDALAFSPIFSHFGETLAGLTTIRAFRAAPLFERLNAAHVDASNRAWWPIQMLNRW